MRKLCLSVAAALSGAACTINAPVTPGPGASDGNANTGGNGDELAERQLTEPAGDVGDATDAVVIVNPTINEGSTITNINIGEIRNEINVTAGDTNVTTNQTGLVLVSGMPTGTVPLRFENGAIDLDILIDGELVDLLLAVTVDGVVQIVPPIRYQPPDSNLVQIGPNDDLAGALDDDNVVVLLEPGTYRGPITITGNNVSLLGSFDASGELLSVIDGDVSVYGTNVRLRTVHIDGNLLVRADNFSAVFGQMIGAIVDGNNIVMIRNTFNGGTVQVTGDNVLLADNVRIQFDPTPPPSEHDLLAGLRQCFGGFGERTTAVVVVNPVVNINSNFELGIDIEDFNISVDVSAADVPTVTVDENGVAIIEGLPTIDATLDLSIRGELTVDAQLDVDVHTEGELFDIIVFATPLGVVEPFPRIKYALGDHRVVLGANESLAAFAGRTDVTIVVAPGTHAGPIGLIGDNLTIMGTCNDNGELESTIEGNLTIDGDNIRIRSLRVTGDLTINGNNVTVAFSEVGQVTINGDNVLLLRNTFRNEAAVNGNDVLLVGNVVAR